MSGRGRGRGGRGRGRGGSKAVGGVTTRSAKRPSDTLDTPEPQTKMVHHEDASSDAESDITFQITESALQAKISAAINSIVPSIVAQTAEAVRKATTTAQTPAPRAPETVTPLQQAVEQQTLLISGNAGSANNNTVSSDIPLDLHLKPEMLANIKGYKYVKFGELLIKEQRDNEKMTLHLGDNTSSKQIMVGPYFNQVKIVHISQWIRAFDIFSYVLVRAHPDDATGLIQYGNLIKDMAFRGLNWANYDRQFRRLKERNPSQHPWGCTDLTLYSQNIIVPRGGNLNPPHQGQNNQNMPFRTQGWQASNSHSNRPVKKCFAYNKSFCKFGPRCRYAHICTKCEGMHPASKCRT